MFVLFLFFSFPPSINCLPLLTHTLVVILTVVFVSRCAQRCGCKVNPDYSCLTKTQGLSRPPIIFTETQQITVHVSLMTAYNLLHAEAEQMECWVKM